MITIKQERIENLSLYAVKAKFLLFVMLMLLESIKDVSYSRLKGIVVKTMFRYLVYLLSLIFDIVKIYYEGSKEHVEWYTSQGVK